MKSRPVAILTAATMLLIAPPTVANAAPASKMCGNYYFKEFSTAGSISAWCNNNNLFVVNAPNGTGFVAMVDGEDWGTWSSGTDLPKRLSSIRSNNRTWFTQKSSPAAGAGYDCLAATE